MCAQLAHEQHDRLARLVDHRPWLGDNGHVPTIAPTAAAVIGERASGERRSTDCLEPLRAFPDRRSGAARIPG
jgi:hypothetical protein